jgi:NAD(P) transhydrogenase subunit alpha
MHAAAIPVIEVYVFILAGFVGFLVISRVPPLLHTPLMSATNAISGISLVGSLVAAGAGHSALTTALGFVAVTAATINVVGGFLITDRMLKMFHRDRPGAPTAGKGPPAGKGSPAHQGAPAGQGSPDQEHR